MNHRETILRKNRINKPTAQLSARERDVGDMVSAIMADDVHSDRRTIEGAVKYAHDVCGFVIAPMGSQGRLDHFILKARA